MSCYACPRQCLPGSFGCALHQPRVTGPAPLLTVAPPLPVDVPVGALPAPALSPWDVPTPRPRRRHGAGRRLGPSSDGAPGCPVPGCTRRQGAVTSATLPDVARMCSPCREIVRNRVIAHGRDRTGVTRAEIVRMVLRGEVFEGGRKARA